MDERNRKIQSDIVSKLKENEKDKKTKKEEKKNKMRYCFEHKKCVNVAKANEEEKNLFPS